MIKTYFKVAFRNFSRHKLFTFINVIGLSIGISAALVIYLIVYFDLSFDRFQKDGDRIYRVVTDYTFDGSPNYFGGVTGKLPSAARSELTGIEESTPFYNLGAANVSIGMNNQTPIKFKSERGVMYADPHYFKIFDYKWLAGSANTSLNGPLQVVITSDQAKKYFPNLAIGEILGKEIIYNDTVRTTVTGILQAAAPNSDFTFHDFISYKTLLINKHDNPELQTWGSTSDSEQLFLKLAPGVNPANIEQQLAALLKRNSPPAPADKGNTQLFKLQPLSKIHFDTRYGAYGKAAVNKTTLYGLAAIAVFLLVLGCINFINLTTAQATQRAREIGIRKTLGSTRWQLIGQYLSETLLVTFFAVLIAVAMAPVMLRTFADFAPAGLTADFIYQPAIAFFLIIMVITVSLLSGLYPALVLSAYQPIKVLKSQPVNGTGKSRNVWMRKSLTVSQFMIAQVFIMATLIVSKQIYYAIHKDLGFKKEAIINVSLPWNIPSPALKALLLNKVRAIPQVEMAALGGDAPSSGGWSSTDVSYADGKREVKTALQTKFGDENYIEIYKINLLAGRNVTMSDSASGILVNRAYLQLIGINDPHQAIGKTINFGGNQNMQIVGVISDFHQGSLHETIKPLAIYPQLKSGINTLHIALKQQLNSSGDWRKALSAFQNAWKMVYPQEEFDFRFFDESIAKLYEREQHIATLLTWATGLCLAISCLGLLGLAIFTTEQRTKEIGVRKVLGASVAQIVRLLSTELILLTLLAFVIVTPLAWYAMNKWMQTFADRTTMSWWIFAASGTGMLLAAVFTSSFQTVKAAVANPVKSLRSE